MHLRSMLLLSAISLTTLVACGKQDDPGAATAPAVMEEVASSPVYAVPLEGAPSIGDRNALVTIVAFTDYECPYCAKADATLEKLRGEYDKELRVVMFDRPLPFHQHAKTAALAAFAAGQQGKYWEMHEQLFKNARSLDDATLRRIASEIGVDSRRFELALASDGATQWLLHAEQVADQFEVTGTPTFFVNGHRIQGARQIEDFRKIIDTELAKAREVLKAGVAAADVYATLMKNAIVPPAPAQNAKPADAHPANAEEGCGCKDENEAAEAR